MPGIEQALDHVAPDVPRTSDHENVHVGTHAEE
jgi:hypothetical protein